MITEEQRLERSKGIGGSDAHHLASLEPYGCRRLLWYIKTLAEPDYPTLETGVMTRGNKLEAITVDEYVESTGRKVRQYTKTIINKKYNYARVHIDGMIVGGETPGILECKTVGRHMWTKVKNEGIPDYWQTQMQWMLFATGKFWGSFAILYPEQWGFITFDIEYDPDIAEALMSSADNFWREVENGPAPDRLDPKDKRCGRCEYRTTCQGGALLSKYDPDEKVEDDNSLFSVISQINEAQQIYDEAKSLLDDRKKELKDKMGDRGIVQGTGFKVYYKPVISKRVNTRKLKSENPDVYEKYVSESVSRPLRIINT